MDTTDIYRMFHPASTKHTSFSAVHVTLSKIDHVLGHKANLSKYKKIEISHYILSDHNGTNLKFNSKRKYRKY
jgi:hypothetical protein